MHPGFGCSPLGVHCDDPGMFGIRTWTGGPDQGELVIVYDLLHGNTFVVEGVEDPLQNFLRIEGLFLPL
ncbi:MAG TPA: hypothetical protein DHV69_07470 [Sphaerochaeta sp.]|nr:hypothetical protein [Sphaerochaeta sp.]